MQETWAAAQDGYIRVAVGAYTTPWPWVIGRNRRFVHSTVHIFAARVRRDDSSEQIWLGMVSGFPL